ncbi:MAG: ATP synthase F1 subunit epsilon [Bacteroidota bacterium]
MAAFDLEIVTPEASIYSGQVTSLMVPGTDGLFQVLVNHAPIISTIGKGQLVLGQEKGGNVSFEVEGGVVEVMNNKAIVLAERVVNPPA